MRQQWNFSAPTSTREIEEYAVELSDVALLELTIVPDISGRRCAPRSRASIFLTSVRSEAEWALGVGYASLSDFGLDLFCAGFNREWTKASASQSWYC